MYQSHWGLDEAPFRTDLDPRFFYQGPTHDEALARLQFLVEQRRRLGLLLGEHGSGKSLLLLVFAREIRRLGLPVAYLNLLGVEPGEFPAMLAAHLGLNSPRGTPFHLLWRQIDDRLAEYRYQRLRSVVLLDDADQAKPDVLAQVSRLAQLHQGPDSPLTLVLAARPEQVGQLGDALLERVELRIDLGPWDESDTENYLRTSLCRAGRKSDVFAPAAIARLHVLSGGVPRRVTQLADLALLAGAGRRLQEIDAETVESVYHELGVIEV
jgi:type II secretory pathway predicted ATPase ExeA